MKKALMIIFIIILVGYCNSNAESQDQVVFYNEDSYYVKLYPSQSACINNEDTDYFVFNRRNHTMKKRLAEMMIVILFLILPQAALSSSDDRYISMEQ